MQQTSKMFHSHEARGSMIGEGNFRKVFSFFVLLTVFLMVVAPAWPAGTSGALTGTVTDAQTGKPISDVFVVAEGTGATYTATTDEKGFFAIVGVYPGDYKLTLKRVGYHTSAYSDVLVSADASTSLQLSLSTQVYQVKGVTVTAYRGATVNPREMFTNYGYSDHEIKQLLPGPASLNITSLYSTLPGVVSSFDYYSGYTQHIRGGTGLDDVGYAFDGVPTNEGLANGYGNNLTNVGTAFTQFYVGAYPVQYGNFLSGYINQVAPRGYGELHGSFEFQYGFWLDPGAALPSYDPATSNLIGYNGFKFPNPDNYNLVLEGQVGKFHYYLNHIVQADEGAPNATGVDLLPNIYFGGTQVGAAGDRTQDTVLNLNYDLDPADDLQLLMSTGANWVHYYGAEQLPCNPVSGNFGAGYPPGTCFGNNPNMNTGVNELYDQYVLAPISNNYQTVNYDLEKLQWTHHMSSATSVTARLWRMNTHAFLAYWSAPFGNVVQPQNESAKGGLVEFHSQLDSMNLVDFGAEEIYNGINFWSGLTQLEAPNGINANVYTPTGTFFNNETDTSEGLYLGRVSAPDTRYLSAWLGDEIRPTPKWDINLGIRWDKQNLLYQTGPGILTQANGLPFVSAQGINSQITDLYTDCDPTGFKCVDSGLNHPSYVTWRAGASYKLFPDVTLKASYGKFVSYGGSHTSDVVQLFATPGMVNIDGVPTTVSGENAVLLQQSGDKPQFGESLDFSVEYGINDRTYLKVTPYVKHINNPYQGIVGPGGAFGFANAGTIGSKGVETLLHTSDWHGFTGFLDWTWSHTRGTQLAAEGGGFASLLSDGPVFDPAYFTPQRVSQDLNANVPANYDITHTVNFLVDYKTPNKKWDIAPDLSYESGIPYGLGADNLRVLWEIENGGAIPPNTTVYNPLGEPNTANGLRSPAFLSGNLAITYHANKFLSTTLSIFNLWNSNQVYGYATDSDFFASAFAYPFLPAYDPSGACVGTPAGRCVKGYAPDLYPSLRQFFVTVHYNF